MLVLPLVIALLVAATGFFTMSMTERAYELHATVDARQGLLSVLGLQIAAIALIGAVLGFGIAIGVTSPLRAITRRLGAVASGDLRGVVETSSTQEVDSLAGAVNEAIRSINRYVLGSMTGAVITLDAEGIVIGSSAAAEATLGYREDEIIGKRFRDVFGPANGARAAIAAIETAIARRQPVSVDEVLIHAKDGAPIRIGVSASYLRRGDRRRTEGREPLPVDADESVGVTITFKDLNEIRRLRDRLQHADQLVTLGTVTAGVAHELRNPLGSLRGLTELLGRDFSADDRRQQYVGAMLAAIDRLNRLVEDLLLLSSPAAPILEDVDPAALAAETVSFVRHGLGDSRATLEVIEEDGAARATISGNRERLAQALANIIRNAVQASPDEATVTVRTTPDGAIHVHNTGSYIPPDQREQLFVPFYTTKATGTGLGLAIARHIIHAQGGRIEIASDPATGTTFTLVLPAIQQHTDGSLPASDARPPMPAWPLATE
jgi:PAS domain S-box-containing protein